MSFTSNKSIDSKLEKDEGINQLIEGGVSKNSASNTHPSQDCLTKSYKIARQKVEYNLKAQGLKIKPVIASLEYLEQRLSVQSIVSLINGRANQYEIFEIKKPKGGYRILHKPSEDLSKIQSYINNNILKKIVPHSSAFAYTSQGGIKECAEYHCAAKWVFKLDLKDFFYSIDELTVYRIFELLGYSRYISVALSKICTVTNLNSGRAIYSNSVYWYGKQLNKKYVKPRPIGRYYQALDRHCDIKPSAVGVLPQGASTSPALSNIAAMVLDEMLSEYAVNNNLKYNRYADDICFSSNNPRLKRKEIIKHRREIASMFYINGFVENKRKFKIMTPASNKVVLGVGVNESKTKSTKEMFNSIEGMIYAIEKFSPESAAVYLKFKSKDNLLNHLAGKLSYLKQIDFEKWLKLQKRFKRILYVESISKDTSLNHLIKGISFYPLSKVRNEKNGT